MCVCNALTCLTHFRHVHKILYLYTFWEKEEEEEKKMKQK